MPLRYEDYVSPSDPWPIPDIWVEVTDGERRVYLIYDDVTPELLTTPEKKIVPSYRRGATDFETRQIAARSRALSKRRKAKKTSRKRTSEPSAWTDIIFKKSKIMQDAEKQEETRKKLKWRLIPVDLDSPRPPNIQQLENELKRVALLESDEEEELDPRKKKRIEAK
ncbi:uncharacterized protein [Venturia canescens]|uniref:uncharacterized protein n=1 Tax=Venturia canescens TaxID=32260 RepID=UPI001C9C6611|nr:uncharacterized protein LOC122406475 [Venturia canescens]XP_043281567.1 uncharacterized protein LOC122414394 [Venturia canescens]XP_043282514.1 uncharacterized protein LOC122414911 [Venturia canescens]